MSNVHNPQKLVSRDFKWFDSMSLHQYICVWHPSDPHQRSIHCSQELQPPGKNQVNRLDNYSLEHVKTYYMYSFCVFVLKMKKNLKQYEVIQSTKFPRLTLINWCILDLFMGSENLAFLTHVVVFRRHELTQTLITLNWVFSDYWLFLTCKRLTKMNYFYECHETLSKWLFSEKYIDRILSDRFYSSII